MASSQLLTRLIRALEVQPGVGPRSATRIAYYLLDHRRKEALNLASCLKEAMEQIRECPLCRDYSDQGAVCPICANVKRQDSRQLCIVESPVQVQTIESTGDYRGLYFILHGHLSPIDGIGPEELGFDLIEKHLKSGELEEVILATNPTVEGEATASYIAAMARKAGVRVTRIASGVPVGGDLDTIDAHTLSASLINRKPY